MGVPLVVDTDIGSDVDDVLALALAVRHPGLVLRAVTTVSSRPDARARIARMVLDAAGATDVEVAIGASAPGDDRNAIGTEHGELLGAGAVDVSSRDAVTVLTGLGRDVAVATIGQQTNLAAAVSHVPDLPRRLAGLTLMGGVFSTFEGGDGRLHGAERDWNLVLDPPAAVTSLGAGWTQLRYVPIDVTFGVPLRRGHVDRLRGGDDLCRLLSDLIDRWGARALPADARADVAAYLHDPLTVACVTDCEFVGAERLRVSVLVDPSGTPRTVVDPTEGHSAEVVRTVDAAAFADWLVETLLRS